MLLHAKVIQQVSFIFEPPVKQFSLVPYSSMKMKSTADAIILLEEKNMAVSAAAARVPLVGLFINFSLEKFARR